MKYRPFTIENDLHVLLFPFQALSENDLFPYYFMKLVA